VPLRKLVESANHAIEGMLHSAKTQRHLRYHFYTAVVILILSLVLGVSKTEFIAIAIVSIIVLSVEMLNTAVEATVDSIFKEYDARAKIIKDIAAGAVLLTAIGAALIGYIIFVPYLKSPLRGGMPSGHAAVAFSVWAAVTFLSEAFMPSFLVLILAVLIAQSRVSVGVHRPWEVILGALLGLVVTFFLFQLFL
jgi:diacylglycerol kinase (ATP)